MPFTAKTDIVWKSRTSKDPVHPELGKGVANIYVIAEVY